MSEAEVPRNRSCRGGSWRLNPQCARVALRELAVGRGSRAYNLGIRLVEVLDE